MRRQLAAYSPLAATPLLRAAFARAQAGERATQQLRECLTREYNAQDVLLLGSGTQALQTAIQLASPPDRGSRVVALPAFTCYDVASAAVGAGVSVRLFDIDPNTLTPDLDSLRRALQDGAGVIVVSPLYGVPIAWEEVSRLASEFGAGIIEDAAQGHGAAWRGRPLGTLGRISILSFGRGKGWTGGRGGAVLLRGENASPLGSPLRRDSGGSGVILVSAAQWLLGRPSLYALPAALPWLGLGETVYHNPVPPSEMTAASAALLLATRADAANEAALRRRHARDYTNQLKEVSAIQLIEPRAESDPGFLRFPLRISGGYRSLLSAGSVQRWGIAPSYPTTLAALEQVQRILLPGNRQFKGAETLAADLITLPTHSFVKPQERQRMIRFLKSI